MSQQRIRQLQRQAAPPTAAPPAQKPFSWQRPFPVPAYNPPPLSRSLPELQARLEILRRANPDWSKVKASSNPAKAVQAKLTVGAPNDQYEQEADHVADQVMSMPDAAVQQPVQREAMPEEEEVRTKPLAASITPLVQREDITEEDEKAVQSKAIASIQREAMLDEDDVQPKLADAIAQREALPDEDDQSLQRQAIATSDIQREVSPDGSLQAGSNLENRLSSSQGGGSPLSNDVRSFMEPRFGADFSQVRVHTGSDAVQMNRDLNAQAFTHKQDVYYGTGKSPAKDALTAHELTHVVQQTERIQTKPSSFKPTSIDVEDDGNKSSRDKIVFNAAGEEGKVAAYKPSEEDESGRRRRQGWKQLKSYFDLATEPGDWSDDVIDYYDGHVRMVEKTKKNKEGKEVKVKQPQDSDLPHWCGIFALWALKISGMNVGTWVKGKGIFSVSGMRQITFSQVKEGDIGCLGGSLQHHFIVSKIEDGKITETINGNSGTYSEVTSGSGKSIGKETAFFTAF